MHYQMGGNSVYLPELPSVSKHNETCAYMDTFPRLQAYKHQYTLEYVMQISIMTM